MPVNASPEFYIAMKKFDEAKTPEEKLKALQELWKVAPKHKGAQKLLLWIKKEIKKYKEILYKERQKRTTKRDEFNIKKTGDALVSLVGIENSGKSYILRKLTKAKVQSTDIPFETTKPEVGVMKYNGALIQIVEVPSTLDSKFCNILRISDLIVVILDARADLNMQISRIKEFIESCGIVLNKKLPNIKVIRTYSGGIKINGAEFIKDATKEEIVKALEELGYKNIEIIIREECDFKTFLDVVEGNKVSRPCIIYINYYNMFHSIPFSKEIPVVTDLDSLKDSIWNRLQLIRVYTKSGTKISENPVILKNGDKIVDLVKKINKKWLDSFKYAIIIRNGKRYRVGLEYELKDGDIVEIKA